MFENLKIKNLAVSILTNRKDAGSYRESGGYRRSPGATSSVIKGDEKDRLVRCRHCGWICDKERDVNLRDGTYAGYGINHGSLRIGPGYDHYYGAVLRTDSKDVLTNGGFTDWPNGWNPTIGTELGPGNWTMVMTGATTGGRVETETALYMQMTIDAGGPD